MRRINKRPCLSSMCVSWRVALSKTSLGGGLDLSKQAFFPFVHEVKAKEERKSSNIVSADILVVSKFAEV